MSSSMDKDDILDYLVVDLLDLVKVMLLLRDVEKASLIAENIPPSYERIEALVKVSYELQSNNAHERALHVLRLARQSSRESLYEWQIAELLLEIARALYHLNEKEDAGTVLEEAILIAKHGEEDESTQNSIDASSVLSDIVKHLTFPGRVSRARELASEIKNPAIRLRSMSEVERRFPLTLFPD